MRCRSAQCAECTSIALLANVRRFAAAFARTGDPNTPAPGVTWPNWPARLVFDASPTQLQITVQ